MLLSLCLAAVMLEPAQNKEAVHEYLGSEEQVEA